MIERSFERALQLRENKGAVKRFAFQQAMSILRAAGVVDPQLEDGMKPASLDKATRSEVPKVDLLRQAYRRKRS